MPEPAGVIEMTYEELEQKILDRIKTDEALKQATKELLETPEMKSLFEQHKEQVVSPEDTVNGEPVKFGQTAKFFRSLMKDDKQELAKIAEEEKRKYIEILGWTEKTLTHYMTETDNAQGYYLVPTEYYAEIMALPIKYGIARRDCRMVPMARARLTVPNLATRPTTQWIAPRVDLAYREKNVTKPTLGLTTLDACKQCKIVVFEEELIADATPPIVEFVRNLMVEAFLYGEDDALFNGNGGNGITGILGTAGVNTVPMGAGNISFANINADDLLDMQDVLPDGVEKGGKYYFHKNTLTHIRKLKDIQGQYIWNAPANNAPGTIWGYPYETVPTMPDNGDSAPDTSFVVFGDLKKCVLFGDRQNLQVKLLEEATIDGTNLAEFDLIGLRFVERLDIEVGLPAGLAVLKTAAV